MILPIATMIPLLTQCAPQVAPSTMLAVIEAESGGNPLAIGINAGSQLVRQPETRAEAIATATSLLDRGVNIDMGLGQINSSNLRALGLNAETVFDACSNIAAAAKILTSNYLRANASRRPSPLGAALSAYNTGSMSRGYANGYVGKVVRAARTVVPAIADATGAPEGALQAMVEGEPQDDVQPPKWDVFAYEAWRRRQAGPKDEGAAHE